MVLPVLSCPAKRKIHELPMTSCLVRYRSLESLSPFSEALTRGPIDVRFYARLAGLCSYP